MTEKLNVRDLYVLSKAAAYTPEQRADLKNWQHVRRTHVDSDIEYDQRRYRNADYATKTVPTVFRDGRERLQYMIGAGVGRWPVWAKESFWLNRDTNNVSVCWAHVSNTQPAMLAYFASDAHMKADRVTLTKPGKFLRSNFPRLTDKQVAYFAEWWATGNRPPVEIEAHVLKISETPEEAAFAYMHGPVSCMDKRHFRNGDLHPARVYSGDTAIAYLLSTERENKVLARAVCCPRLKAFGRVYPTADNHVSDGYRDRKESIAVYDSLYKQLRDKGWRHIHEDSRALDGAKIAAMPRGRDYWMPYLDGFGVNPGPTDPVTNKYEHFIVSYTNYQHRGGNTDGSLYGSGDYDDDAHNEDPDGWECEQCGNNCDEDASSYSVFTSGNRAGLQQWCENCYENTFTCSGCDDTFSDDVDSVTVDDEIYSRYWFLHSGGGYFCEATGEPYFEADNPSVEMNDGGRWCPSYFAENGWTDPETGVNHPNEAMFEWTYDVVDDAVYYDLHKRTQEARNYGPTTQAWTDFYRGLSISDRLARNRRTTFGYDPVVVSDDALLTVELDPTQPGNVFAGSTWTAVTTATRTAFETTAPTMTGSTVTYTRDINDSTTW